MTVRIGYVGLDHHHREPYLDTIEQLDAEIVATADPYGKTPDSVESQRLSSLPWYESVEALCDAEDLDVVWLTLSNQETPEAIAAAADAGVDVLSEKPGAKTAAALEQVADRVADAGITVGFAYTWRAHPIARDIRNRATNGFFGSVRGFDLRFIASRLATRPTDHYLFDAAASRGGILQWLGVHWIDLLPWLLDDPIVRVNAAMTAGEPSVDVEDGATLQLELASGAIGTLSAGYYLRDGRYDTAIEIYGDQGHSSWDPMGPTFGFDGETAIEYDSAAWTSTPHRTITHEYEPTPGYGGRWGMTFFEEFLAARESASAVPADMDATLRVLKVLDAAYDSVERDEWVAVQ
ncbi:Gfo/Idh/MocA family protein [Halorarius litoreus]|uniref:Gfo/Idh/MocA family protein n=1 Tax=Halorarius litoreus TaxID=2962676 RepID=UPI0020CBF73E|nr:Gfo/Idh/MocA family oxidoreductase [Halorarius litoreus]